MDKQKEYLDKVVKHMIQRFKDSEDNKFQRVDMKSFVDFGETFGLTDLELNYVYHKYFYLKGWNEKDISSWYLNNNINESVDKQTEFLKKVVDIMMRDTKEYGFIKNVLHVITPFIAYPGKYVLSANHCKNMVDYFDDEFRLGKIFNDYLEAFGLSYE